MGDFWVSVSKPIFVRNHSYENMFRLEVHYHGNQIHFHVKSFARGLVLKQRHKLTRKWSIISDAVQFGLVVRLQLSQLINSPQKLQDLGQIELIRFLLFSQYPSWAASAAQRPSELSRQGSGSFWSVHKSHENNTKWWREELVVPAITVYNFINFEATTIRSMCRMDAM